MLPQISGGQCRLARISESSSVQEGENVLHSIEYAPATLHEARTAPLTAPILKCTCFQTEICFDLSLFQKLEFDRQVLIVLVHRYIPTARRCAVRRAIMAGLQRLRRRW